MLKGFLYKSQIEELFIVVVYFWIATYLSKARYSLFVLKVPLNPISQSINQSISQLFGPMDCDMFTFVLLIRNS